MRIKQTPQVKRSMLTFGQLDRGIISIDRRLTVAGLIVALWLVSPSRLFAEEAAEPTPFASPVSAGESLEHFQLHPDLHIELVAAEPEVIDPVAITFDEQNRMWVVEMSDYPNGPQAGETPKSRIRLLEDQNNDGRYETSHVFADQLLFATGVQPWRGGVIVTLAGRVAYFRDSDGDNRADVEETWFTGFAEKNPQLRANHPTFALDNHVYIANGLRGGDVVARKQEWSRDAKPVSISGMDVRFDPNSGRYEAISGAGQFGLTFDDFGNRFICSNRNPCMHVVLEDRYIKRNPFLAVGRVVNDVSPVGENSRVYAISRTWTTSTLHAGQFTAACGVTIYRGDLLPAEFQGNSFTCEPTGNLVHRDVLAPQGATFRSRPGRESVEFLATRDEWFRPVNLANGPDGALYVVDMYRAVIEHPQWVPDELKNRPDNYYGNDRGRIYRITSSTRSAAKKRPDLPPLETASAADLVTNLEHPNSWQRETAARLIYERQERAIGPALRELATNGNSPQARIHALWGLDGLGLLSTDIIARALDDPHPRVREQAIRLSEPHLTENQALRAALKNVKQEDHRLRFQWRLSIGQADVAEYFDALSETILDGAEDPWTRIAVASSSGDHSAELLVRIIEKVFTSSQPPSAGGLELIALLAEIVGSRQKQDEIQAALAALNSSHDRPVSPASVRLGIAGMNGLGRGLNRRGRQLAGYVEAAPQALRERVQAFYREAAAIARSEQAKMSLRLAALNLLKHAGYETAGETLLLLARDVSNQEIRVAAIGVQAGYADAEIAPALLADFAAGSPTVRRAILNAMLAETGRTLLLLKEIEAGRIRVSELDAGQINRLTRHRNQEIQAKAKQLLAAATPADRKQVLDQYQQALALSADPKRGREVFNKNCTACHRIGTLGVNVAPDIADSRTRTPAALLTDILDPNRAIDNNYFSYTVVDVNGKVHTGIVTAETASSITLKQQENKTLTILRQDIEEMRSNGISLMPVGLEKNIPVEQMADLISFIKNWRYLDGRIPIDVGQ